MNITKIGCKSSFWLCYFLYSYLDNKFVYIVFIFTIFMVGCCGFVLFTWLRKVPKLNHSMYVEASPLTQNHLYTISKARTGSVLLQQPWVNANLYIHIYTYIEGDSLGLACVSYGRVSDTSIWESCLGDDSIIGSEGNFCCLAFRHGIQIFHFSVAFVDLD